MGEKDYYLILGLPPSATPEEITAAYLLLARKHHPDVKTGAPSPPTAIKDINEAFEVLSDAEKRKVYDRFRVRRPPAASSTRVVSSTAQSFNWCKEPAAAASGSPGDIVLDLPVAPEEAWEGGPCDCTLTIPRQCGRCGGRGRIEGNLCSACLGKGARSDTRRLQIMLPAHAKTGTLIRIAEYGKPCPHTSGDLLLRLRVQPCW